MSTLSAVIKNGQQIQLRSGMAALNPNDLVQLVEPASEIYPVGTIDYDKQAASGSVVAEVNVDAASHPFSTYHRHSALVDLQGNIYVPWGSATFCRWDKVGVTGTQLIQTTVGGDAGAVRNAHAVWLGPQNGSGGTMAVTFACQTAGTIAYTVVDRFGNAIVPQTNIGTAFFMATSHICYFTMCPLSNGGFAVAYLSAAGTAMMLACYDQSGTQTLAPTSIQAFTTAGDGAIYVKMGQLPNGNLVVVMRAPTSTGPTPGGTTFVIVTTAGASVVTNTIVNNLTGVAYGNSNSGVKGFQELNILGAFFAVGGLTGTPNITDPQAYLAVYNQAGALQGTKYASSNSNASGSGISSSYPQCAIANDGVGFWFGYPGAMQGSLNKGSIANITTAGVTVEYGGLIPTGQAPFFPETGGSSVDMTVIGGYLVAFQSVAAGAINPAAPFAKLWTLPNPYSGFSYPSYNTTVSFTIGTAAATQGASFLRVIPSGLSAIFVYDKQNVAAMFAQVTKLFTSSIMGINQGQVVINTPGVAVGVAVGATSAPINPIQGTDGAAFDHSAATPHGNKGTLYRTGVVQAGL